MFSEGFQKIDVVSIVAVLVAGVGLPARAEAGSCDDDRVEKVVELVNEERSSRGLGELECAEKLVLVAEAHSRDQCEHNRMSHEGSDGSRFPERFREAGINFRSGAENVSRGPMSAEMVHRGWMNSTGHRRNILRKGMARIGVGFVKCENGRFWTQTFAGPDGGGNSRETADGENARERVEGDRRRSCPNERNGSEQKIGEVRRSEQRADEVRGSEQIGEEEPGSEQSAGGDRGSEQMAEEEPGSEQRADGDPGSDGSEADDQLVGSERGADDEKRPDDEPADGERGDDGEGMDEQATDDDEQFAEEERGSDEEDDGEQDGEEPFDGDRPFEEKEPFDEDDPFEEEPFDGE